MGDIKQQTEQKTPEHRRQTHTYLWPGTHFIIIIFYGWSEQSVRIGIFGPTLSAVGVSRSCLFCMPVVVDTAGALLYVIMHNGRFQFGSVGHCINNSHHRRIRKERTKTEILNNGCKGHSPTEWKHFGRIRSHGSGEIFKVLGKLGMVKNIMK